eukprot:tig00000157_g9598.t1
MPDALAAAEAIYEEGMNRHKASQYVALNYAIFLHGFKKNPSSAMVRLRLAERSPRRALDMAFFLAAKRREWTQREYSASLGEAAGISAVAVLEFQMLMDEATRHQNAALREIRALWKTVLKSLAKREQEGRPAALPPAAVADSRSTRRLSLLAPPPAGAGAGAHGSRRRVAPLLPGGRALHATSLETKVASIHRAKRAAEQAYRRLLSRFTRSPALWRAYAYFLLVSNEEREANESFARADELEESAALEANLASAYGGSLAGGTVEVEDPSETASRSSRLSKPKRERHGNRRGSEGGGGSGNPVSELLVSAALGGTRAVRDLRRAIVAACVVLLLLLVVLCGIMIAQLDHQLALVVGSKPAACLALYPL